MRKENYYYLTVLALLLISLLIAIAFGFISADSWEYISLAHSIRQGDGCSVNGAYFAVLPCGYPLAIAFTAPSADFAGLMIGSKFTNLLLLSSAFVLLAKEHRNVFVPAIITLSPVTMAIYQYTWSENLLIFAIAGSLFSISRIYRNPIGQRQVALLALFLVVGCAARYFFGPFAVLMFFGILLIYGRATAIKTFPAFLVAGAFFVGYQEFNAEMTGYGSGMPRIVAPETITYLILRFFNSLAHIAVYVFVSIFLFLAISSRSWRFSPKINLADADLRRYLYLAWLGAGYLFLAFFLRALRHFDMYDTRTIGFGLVLLSAGAVGFFIRPHRDYLPFLAVVGCGIFAIVLGQGSLLPSLLRSAWINGYRAPLTALRDYHAPRADADLIIALATPDISPTVSGNSSFYYKPGTRVLSFAGAPFRKSESLDAFKERARDGASKSCLIDFNPLNSTAALRAHVDASYVVDLQYDFTTNRPFEVKKPVFDSSVRQYVISKFEPGRYVDCSDIISQ